MVFHEPTPAVNRALAAAREWAARRARDAVGPRELFLGLLDEPEGRPSVLLERFGLNILTWTGPTPRTSVTASQEIPFDAVADRVCRLAQRLARVTEDHTCTTDHLLLALLESATDLRAELSVQGLDVPGLERELRGDHAVMLALDEPIDWTESGESFDAARILDANANRAREALRVLEDYCRFVLSDALLSRELKELRHGLADALAELPGGLLLAARDTDADVGTAITTPREQERYALRAVVTANFKRLQESLRTLEEYGKLRDAELGGKLEALRYRTYTLERMLLLTRDRAGAGGKLADARLYILLSAATCRASLEWTIAEAAAGGADVIQLREKSLSDRELLERARDVRRWTHKAGVLFIVNDRPDIARLAEADGVHLGQDDLPVRDARRIVGTDALVGVSTHTLDQVRQAVRDGANYIGVGPTFPSTTKEFDHLAGLEFVRAATAETSLPAFVLGGVTVKNVGDVVAAGGRRVAVSAAIAQADDPRAAASALRRAVGS